MLEGAKKARAAIDDGRESAGRDNGADRDYVPPGDPGMRRFELIPFEKIAIDTTPAYLVKGIVPRVGLCVFWGAPKCGKSFLVFDMLMHVALGWEYRGRKVRRDPSSIAP